MKRLSFLLAILLAVIVLPGRAEAQFTIGARGKVLLPLGDFNDEVTTGWGAAAVGDFTLIPLIKLRGEIGYNHFDGEEPDGDLTFEDRNIWNFGIGARLQLPIVYFSLDGMYYTDIDEFSALPGLGLRFLFLDVGARYKWTGANWFEVFAGVAF